MLSTLPPSRPAPAAAIALRPLHPAFGAEVCGLDLSGLLPAGVLG